VTHVVDALLHVAFERDVLQRMIGRAA